MKGDSSSGQQTADSTLHYDCPGNTEVTDWECTSLDSTTDILDELLQVTDEWRQNPFRTSDRSNLWKHQILRATSSTLEITNDEGLGPYHDCLELAETEEDDIIGNNDPSRSPPRVYLRISRCLEAIEKELAGLTTPDSRGIPSLKAIRMNQKE